MDKQELFGLIYKAYFGKRLISDFDKLKAALQSCVVLSVDEADAVLNDDGNDNQSAVDEIERQLSEIEARRRK